MVKLLDCKPCLYLKLTITKDNLKVNGGIL